MSCNRWCPATRQAIFSAVLMGVAPIAGPRLSLAAEIGPDADLYSRVAIGHGLRVKVARKAGVWISRPGSDWVHLATGVQALLYDAAFGNGLFVVVGNEGTLLTSANGVAWVKRNASTDERLRGIAFGAGRFVAVGYAGTVITSPDGIHWTPRRSGTSERLQLVRYDAGKFVAVTRNGKLLTSRNGRDWRMGLRRPGNRRAVPPPTPGLAVAPHWTFGFKTRVQPLP